MNSKLSPPPTRALQPLPSLKVIRETYCNQEMTDALLDFLQEKRPDLIKRLIETEQAIPENFVEVLEKSADFLKAEASTSALAIPATYIGIVDLLFELSRRFESVYGWRRDREPPHFKVRGKPLAESATHPLPGLPDLAISKSSHRHGLTQERVDKTLRALYEQHPELWFDLAEEIRRNLPLVRTERAFVPLLQGLSKDDPRLATMRPLYAFINEIRRRTRLMCDLSFSN